MPRKIVTTKDLKTATEQSIKAVLSRRLSDKVLLDQQFSKRPGVISGFVALDDVVAGLDNTPQSIAKEIAQGVGSASGIRVTPATVKFPGGVLIGYVPPVMRSKA
jgi:hypothetical protein